MAHSTHAVCCESSETSDNESGSTSGAAALRHTSITQAAELGQRPGLWLDKIRTHSRHKSIATLMLYVDEHNRIGTQRSLAGLIASTVGAWVS
jgi:hypothetical protein